MDYMCCYVLSLAEEAETYSNVWITYSLDLGIMTDWTKFNQVSSSFGQLVLLQTIP